MKVERNNPYYTDNQPNYKHQLLIEVTRVVSSLRSELISMLSGKNRLVKGVEL